MIQTVPRGKKLHGRIYRHLLSGLFFKWSEFKTSQRSFRADESHRRSHFMLLLIVRPLPHWAPAGRRCGSALTAESLWLWRVLKAQVTQLDRQGEQRRERQWNDRLTWSWLWPPCSQGRSYPCTRLDPLRSTPDQHTHTQSVNSGGCFIGDILFKLKIYIINFRAIMTD